MASQKQIEANTRNASRSTGPKSAEGKARVARNALKHGLAGHGVIVPAEMTGQIQDRKGHWRKEYRPDGPSQEWLFERICIESVRADSCVHRLIALRDEAATRAGESWDDDRALEAEELGAKLGRTPELVQPKLLQTRHGALWLIAQWEELERQHDLNGEWADRASARALDLLGVPIDARDGVWSALTGGIEDSEGVRALIRDERTLLRRRVDDYLDDRDDRARADAEVGLVNDGPDVRRVLRFEGEALRRLRGWTRELRRLQGGASGSSDRPRRATSGAESGPPPDWPGPTPEADPEPAIADDRRDAPAGTPDDGPMLRAVRDAVGFPARSTPHAPNRRSRRAQASLKRRSRRS